LAIDAKMAVFSVAGNGVGGHALGNAFIPVISARYNF